MTRPASRIATRLDDIYQTVSREPLIDPDDLRDFYVEEVNEVRQGDVAEKIARGLRRGHRANPYKAFVMGHPGVGKSTELSRVITRSADLFEAIRIDYAVEINPITFNPFDVLVVMMSELVKRTAAPPPEGLGRAIGEALLDKIFRWFAAETHTRTVTTAVMAEAEAGAGPGAESALAKLLGLFARLRGQAQFRAEEETEVVQQQLSRISSLIELCNELLRACNDALYESQRREWLIVGEGFDNPKFSVDKMHALFITQGDIFRQLQGHQVFTIPIALGQSSQAIQLPVPQERQLTLPDTPVYEQDKRPHEGGRAALRRVVERRMSLDLLEPGQLDRLIVASGGNLRDLFFLVEQAADYAALNGRSTIAAADGDRVIRELRRLYEQRLGDNPFDADEIPYEKKAETLLRIYQRAPDSTIPDRTLYALLQTRAVQELNGRRWYGVHPLVVDILDTQGRLEGQPRTPSGGIPGGTI